ncbi:hypothetical protein HYT57_00265 [Candidatus Woesearchaeota archaeon]|nr:hypothetical protein [Candidatus Woesearchaeota archaeon]
MERNGLYPQIHSMKNLFLAFKEARKGKTKKYYVKRFEKNLIKQLLNLNIELKSQKYHPEPLRTFILRDPKTRKISKSVFRDRVVHHALVRMIEPIFDKNFIYDSCANRKGKGNLFALKRFDLFKRKITNNLTSKAFCLKADIKHYFQEVNHEILLNVIERKIKDEKVMWLIKQILGGGEQNKGMPLGNLTSQFFANIYLNELDRFVKHKLKTKYYIRYVDDFVILYNSKKQLEIWKSEIDNFLKEKLKLELHPDKSKIIPLSRGIDFVGFRNFYHHRLLRKRNIGKMFSVINKHKKGEVSKEKLIESFQGWQAYAKWANSYKITKKVNNEIQSQK